MSAVAVLRLPLSTDLSGFVSLLKRLQVPHRVSEEAGEQVVWAPDGIADDVRSLYQRFPQGDPEHQLPVVERPPAMARPALSSNCATVRPLPRFCCCASSSRW